MGARTTHHLHQVAGTSGMEHTPEACELAPAVGVFVPDTTRDGVALARNGQQVVAVNALDASGDEDLVEVQFRDGQWMLCTAAEVRQARP